MKSAVFCRKAGEKCFSWTATHSCYKNYAEKKNRRTFAASKVYNQHSNSLTRLQPLPSRLDVRIRCLRHTIVLYAIEFAPCVSSHPLSRKCHFRVHRNSNLSHRMCCKVSSFFRVLRSKRYQCLGQPQHHALTETFKLHNVSFWTYNRGQNSFSIEGNITWKWLVLKSLGSGKGTYFAIVFHQWRECINS